MQHVRSGRIAALPSLAWRKLGESLVAGSVAGTVVLWAAQFLVVAAFVGLAVGAPG